MRNFSNNGYIYQNNAYSTFTVSMTGGARGIYGMNNAGAMVGDGPFNPQNGGGYSMISGWLGTVANDTLNATSIRIGSAWWDAPSAISNNGLIAGTYCFPVEVNSFGAHAYVMAQDFSWITLPDHPDGVNHTGANGINVLGHVVGTYTTYPGTHIHGYFYDGNSFTELLPEAALVTPTGINDHGQIVGYYRLSGSSEIHCFLATPVPENSPPVAVCQNVTVPAGSTCTASASINNGSFDPDGDAITMSPSPPGLYPRGGTPVTLTVTDSKGASSQCTGTVTVDDETPPTISSVSATPSVLKPANKKMVNVTVNYNSTDNCDQPACAISSVTSNQVIDTSDFAIVDGHHVKLAAERDKKKKSGDRIYYISITCADVSGNSSSQVVTVTVP